jgi:hypothetical protein
MMKHLSVVFLCVFATVVSAQNEADVLRYSSETLGSTARSFGVAGAFGAIGADPSSAAINPSGLARFRTSNIFMSMGFYNAKTRSQYINTELTDNKFNFNIPNVGLIVNIRGEDYETKNPEGFVNFVVGFNMNRLNNFHKRSIFNANNTTSITQEWAERASRTETIPDNFSPYSLEHLAYSAWLIDKDTTSQTIPRYISAYGNNGIDVNQRGIILSRGALNDYNFSFGGNYKHLLLFGVALGAKSVRYIEENNFTETDIKKANIADIKSVTLDKYLHTSGLGFNAKIGATVTPFEFLRIGYALHTPTVFNLTDSYSYTIKSVFDQGARDGFGDFRQSKTVSTESTVYKYKISTPARHVLSVGLVNKDAGFISLDVETVNYASAYMQPKDPTEEPFLQENLNIKNNFRRTFNFRIGGEAIYQQYRFRAGYARYPSPYKEGVVPFISSLANNVYTLGFGIKTSSYSFDFAYVNSGYADYTVPYSLNKLPNNTSNYTITNNVRAVNFVVSAGIKLD